MTGTDPGMPRSEALAKTLRGSRTFRELAPMESGIGWPVPIPVFQDGEPRVYARLPLFVLRPDPAGGADLFPPFATATLDWSTGRLVEYTDLRFKEPHRSREEWSHPVGHFPHSAVAGLSTAGYRALRTQLFDLYDELFSELSHGRQFSGDGAAEFRGLLGRLLEPCLLPHYRRLAPKFLQQYLPDHHVPDEG
ncbi:hypothetical protein [Streptomyces sp. NBC_01794]|uniref:hypothetical protein n=1 Tax=Streptomyces sp. NBC_01794 TaxID=2975942 RepID=UPI003086EB57|nr:hypothetical protein OIE54_39455 [Streptomyces sp. NBC_01794]